MRPLPAALLLAACAPPPSSALPDGPTALAPAADEVDGYVVERAEIDLTCPDGQPARLWLARPEDLAADTPVAIVFHTGAFDWVDEADPADPLDGDHLASPSRLDRPFAAREVFAALGMWDSAESSVDSDGALAVALAGAGAAIVLPEGCWGDLWHNEVVPDEATGRENDVEADGFARDGFAAARRAWDLVTVPGAAADAGLALPLAGTTEVWLVGQGTGGRAVSELLHDGAEPDAVALDATPDDLGALLAADQGAWGGWTDGLPRVFPGGPETMAEGALATAPLPDRVAFLWSSADDAFPSAAYDGVLARLAEVPGAVVIDTGLTAHVGSAGDLDAAAALVGALLPPAAAPARSARTRR